MQVDEILEEMTSNLRLGQSSIKSQTAPRRKLNLTPVLSYVIVHMQVDEILDEMTSNLRLSQSNDKSQTQPIQR